MGNSASSIKKSKNQFDNFYDVVDYIATYYILTMDFKSLSKLSEKAYCDKLVILTSDIIERYFNETDVTYLAQRVKNGQEVNDLKKERLSFINKDNLESLDISNDTQKSLKKKRVCIGIAKFYVKIAHVFAAIVMTINPMYSYKDATGQTVKTGLMEKDKIPKNVDRKLYKLNISKPELALLCQKAENHYVGMPCGIMDQSVSIMATEGHALLLDCRDLSIEQIPFDIAPHGLELLVIDTQVHHELVDGGYAERRASCEKAVADLNISSLRDISVEDFVSRKNELDPVTFKRAFHAVTEMRRVKDAVAALKKDDFVTFGKIVSEAHSSLRDNYTVSCPELDLAADTANENGALGARMIGGGFGGSAIALVKKGDAESVKGKIAEAFAESDFRSPRFFASSPSSGASVISSR